MIETVLLAVTAFVSTNMDDLMLGMLFFSEAERRKERLMVMIGKYAGMGALVLTSTLGALGMQLLPEKRIALLGFVPLLLGIRYLIEAVRKKQEKEACENEKMHRHSVLRVALITVANGADNIGVYVPVFAAFAPWQMVLTDGVFVLLTGIWCWLSMMLANVPEVKKVLLKYKKGIVPVVYMALGCYILLKGWL
ncbi:MAG: cadmium resistance transporter [Clostridia bacterium]|nr:cadmium resistance transporter [Clostridia bacterium]